MTSNESFAQVPLDVAEETSIRRTLQKIVEEVDIILGNRADDPYVTESSLSNNTVSLTSLDTSINELQDTLTSFDGRIEDNSVNIEEQQVILDDVQYTVNYRSLDASYTDFDNAVWGTLKGKGQFSSLGSGMTNPPFAVTAGTTYIVYADSAITTGGGVVQTVMMEDTGVDVKVFVRTGDTFAVAVTNGWTQL